MHEKLRLSFGVFGSLAALAGIVTPIAAEQPTSPGFAQELTVSEVSLVVQPPRSWGPTPSPKDVRVQEAGESRTVTRLEALSDSGQWQILIYVDIPLSDHQTVLAATGALADLASKLTSRGEVRVAVADPQPWQHLGPTRKPRKVVDALTEVAFGPMGAHEIVQLRHDFSRVVAESPELAGAAAEASLPAEIETVRRQTDRLLGFVAGGCPSGACALFLVADGFSEQPAAFYSQASGLEDLTAESLGPVAEELGSMLAAYGWTVFPLPLRGRRSPNTPTSSFSEFDSWQEDEEHRDDDAFQPQMRIGKGRQRRIALEALDIVLLPMAAPLRRIAEASGGTVVRAPSQLDTVLTGLKRRMRLWYRAPRPHPEALVPVEIRSVADARVVQAPRWALASTPAGVTMAHLRGLLEGWGKGGSWPLKATIEQQVVVQGEQLLTVVLDLPTPREAGRDTRVFLAYLDPDGVTETVLDSSQLEPTDESPGRIRLSLPEEIRRIAIAVDAPSTGEWGGTVVDLPEPGGYPGS